MNLRNKGVDIIRGFCILAVILLHINIHFGFTRTFLKELIPPKLFSLLFWSGYYGVVIFFTLSGFLITSSILKKWGTLSKVNVKTFYWFRFARIIPLLAVLLLVLSVLHLTNTQGFVINEEQTSLARAIFSALTFHINWLEIQVGYLPANWDILWSISIEETFYLAFPIICLFLKKNNHFVFVLAIFLAVSPWARTNLFIGNELADKNHLAYLDSIALGCMSAIVVATMKVSKWSSRIALILGSIMVIFVLYFRGFVYKSGITSLGLNITILSLGIALIMPWLYRTNRFTNFRVLGWVEGMGKYSYEIYLTHMFVILLGAKAFKHLRLAESWLLPFTILLSFTSFFLGKLVHVYFSGPVNRWLRRKWLYKSPNLSAKNN